MERLQNLLTFALALLAVASLAHVLLTSIRRRARDLATLKAMGFSRGQVAAAVAWQSSAIGVVAALIGLPLGIVAGRWAWSTFAEQLGVPTSPYVSVPAMLACGFATVVLANVIAAVPGRVAGRVQPARVLRAE